LEASYT